MDPPNQYDVSDLAHGLGMLSVGQKYRQNNLLLFTSAIFIYTLSRIRKKAERARAGVQNAVEKGPSEPSGMLLATG